MKKSQMIVALVAMVMVCGLWSCNNEEKKPNAAGSKVVGINSGATKNVKIAFVDLDSLMARYQYYLDCSNMLEKKSESINRTLNNKGLALQKEMAEFQEKIQKGTVTEEQALKMQTSLQNKQAQLQTLQQNLTEEFQVEQEKYNAALHDSLNNFLTSYNKTAGYTFILARSNDNILLADPQYDITDDVINGLNKRYKK